MTDLPKKPRNHHPERIVLSADSLHRINAWMAAIAPKLKGRGVSRSELVNWLIDNRSAELTECELASIMKSFFDPVKALAWATREIQDRQKAGETIDVASFLSETLNHKPKKTLKKPRKIMPALSTEST